MTEQAKSKGLLREEDRQWVQQQAQRYKTHVNPYRRLGPRSRADRARDHRLRRKVQRALEDLVWLNEVWPPDQQNRVFTKENVENLVSGLLAARCKTETEEDRKDREERQYALGAMFMEKGVNKCMQKVDEPYRERVQRDALSLMLTLKKATLGPRAGVSLGI